MHWFKKTLAMTGLGALSISALGQEPARHEVIPAVRLGTPTPWKDSGVVRAFSPFTPPGAIQQASHSKPAPPLVVRGVGPMLGDEPKLHFLPRELPPLDESKLIWPPAPSLAPTLPCDVPPMVPVTGKPKFIEVSGEKAIEVVAESPAAVTRVVSDDAIILVDESGSPIFDSGFGGANRFYAKAEWLLWWSRGFRVPPLVVSDTDPNLNTQGILGNGTAQVLFGDGRTASGGTSGGRFTAGYYLDECGYWAVEGSFFFVGRKNQNATFTSDQFPVLARPLFDLNTGVPFRELVTTPALATGTAQVETSSSLFGNPEINLRRLMTCPCSPVKITGLAGFRALNLSESLRISESSNVLVNIPVPQPDLSFNAGDVNSQTDRFDTRNRFFGGQIGAAAEFQRERWIFELRAKLAIGATYQTVDIAGNQQVVGPNGRNFNFAGALYAVDSNSGRHTQTRVGFIPEVGVNVGYQLTDNLRVFAGYDFLYWSSVLRPGDQIDQGLDLNRVNQSGRPYPPINQVRPRVPFQTSSYWAQGVNAGLLLRY